MLDDEVDRDGPPTKRTRITHTHGEHGDVRALARELAQLRHGHEADRRERSTELAASERRSTWWRWAGGIAASVALTMGGSALRLAVTASSDHDLVQRHEVTLRERHEHDARLLEQSARTAAVLEELRAAITDLRTDVREVRAETRRITEEERRHR